MNTRYDQARKQFVDSFVYLSQRGDIETIAQVLFDRTAVVIPVPQPAKEDHSKELIDLRAKVKTLQEVVTVYRDGTKAYETTIKDLQGLIKSLREQKKDLESKLASSDSALTTSRALCNELRKSLYEERNARNTAEGKLAADINKLKHTNFQQQDRINGLTNIRHNLEKSINTLRAKVQNQRAEINRLTEKRITPGLEIYRERVLSWLQSFSGIVPSSVITSQFDKYGLSILLNGRNA